MNKYLLTIVLAGMAVPALSGERLGLAKAGDEFRLTRGETVQTHRAGFLAAVEQGDTLAAGKTALRVEQAAAGTYIVAPGSTATSMGSELVRLESGALVVASDSKAVLRATTAGLVVEPASAEDRTIYVLRTAEPKAAEVEAVAGGLLVRDAATNAQVGFLAEGDALRFDFDGQAWKAGSIGTGQDATTTGEDGVTGEQLDNKRRAALLLRGPGGAAISTGTAAGGLGAGAAITTIGVGAIGGSSLTGGGGGDDGGDDQGAETPTYPPHEEYYEKLF